MKFNEREIKQILLEQNYLEEGDLKNAESLAKKEKITLLEALLIGGYLTKDLLGQALAEYYQVAYADLNTYFPGKNQVLKIPEKLAKENNLVLFKEGKKEVIVATDNPAKKGLSALLKPVFKSQKIVFNFSLTEDIQKAFNYYRKTLDTRFSQIIKNQKQVAPEIIEEIIKDALDYNASDIHFEPQQQEVAIRFRIDGVLQEAGRIAKEYYSNILNRLKIQGHMRIDEHNSAQDGAIRLLSDNLKVDLRLSVVPVLDGEKVVIRLLAKHVTGFKLKELGLSESDEKIITEATQKPFGMILSVGPTGSGKTTTLYALLKTVNRPEVNITTIEDPVEYKISNANQIQVNQATDLTFTKGLRSIVRQDPDIILVGEIRDKETAEIAVNASLTGHLLFSSFHANDAASAIPRLLDMGLEPFLLASTLELVMAQRLARKICDSCRVSAPLSKEELSKLPPDLAKQFAGVKNVYKGKGCPSCNNTGYKGRIALFEIISITPEIHEAIIKNPTAGEIWRIARSQGSHSLFADGLEKVKQGITTLEEVLRIAEIKR